MDKRDPVVMQAIANVVGAEKKDEGCLGPPPGRTQAIYDEIRRLDRARLEVERRLTAAIEPGPLAKKPSRGRQRRSGASPRCKMLDEPGSVRFLSDTTSENLEAAIRHASDILRTSNQSAASRHVYAFEVWPIIGSIARSGLRWGASLA
jgi:hypothetical protein